MNIEYFVEEHNIVRNLVHLHILDVFLKLNVSISNPNIINWYLFFLCQARSIKDYEYKTVSLGFMIIMFEWTDIASCWLMLQ